MHSAELGHRLRLGRGFDQCNTIARKDQLLGHSRDYRACGVCEIAACPISLAIMAAIGPRSHS
jgi:hypothetical protein